ncbi:MAG: hypothetical protein J6Q13_01365 [Clostridia bacterium]|nr:hypothetical protein [Clostridia bacterium]
MTSLEKLIKIVTNAINGIKEDVKLSKKEAEDLEDLLYEFGFLYCYPNDNMYYNSTILGQALQHNRFLQEIYYEGTKEYEDLMKDEELANGINSFGIYVKDEHRNQKNTHIARQKFPYIKQDKVVKRFCYIVNNDEVYNKRTIVAEDFRHGKVPVVAFLFPTVLTEKQKQELINSKYFIGKQDNIYSFKITHPLFYDDIEIFGGNIVTRIKSTIPTFIQKFARDYIVQYVEIEGKLFEREYYEDGSYNVDEIAKKLCSRIYIVDETGNRLENETLNAGEIFHDIRTAIAHCRIYDYQAFKHNTSNFDGKIYLISKEDKNKNKISRAVLCPTLMLEIMNFGNSFNFNPENREFYYVCYPKLNKKISTPEQAQEFQNGCVVVKIKMKENVDEHYLNHMVYQSFRNYNETNQEIEIQEYLKTKLSEKFPIVTINILQITDEKWLNQKFKDNKDFYNIEFEGVEETQIDYIENVFYKLCDPVSLTSEWNKGKKSYEEKRFQYSGGGVSNILRNIDRLIQYWLKAETEYDLDFMVAYKTEVYYVLCMIVAYSTLIKNGFAEDIEYITEIEISKMYSYHRKIDSENMDRFKSYSLIKNIDRSGKPLKTVKDKLDVVRWIRNGICHFGTYIKLDGSYNYENNMIVFVSENEKENHPDNAVVVTCKDLLEFCIRPIFTKYNQKKKLIVGYDFDEVINKTVEELKKPL